MKVCNIGYSKESVLDFPQRAEYHTFLIDLTNMEVEFSNNWEFSEIDWFHVVALPEFTHQGGIFLSKVFWADLTLYIILELHNWGIRKL